MDKHLVDALTNAKDKFAFVLDSPQVHHLASDGDLVGQLRREAHAALTTTIERSAFELGLIHVTRRFSSATARDLFDTIGNIEKSVSDSEEVLLRARLTRAAILFSIQCDDVSALSEFDKCFEVSAGTEDHFVYALSSKGMGDASLRLGRFSQAEEYYENAIVTFRRYGFELLLAFVINNLGVLKKNVGDYATALRLLQKAQASYRRLEVPLEVVNTNNNLGFVCSRLGDWATAQRWFESADSVCDKIVDTLPEIGRSEARWACATPMLHLMSMQRRFSGAEAGLKSLVNGDYLPDRVQALAHEFIGEMYTETDRFDAAKNHLDVAFAIVTKASLGNDVMTEVLRRRAEVQLRRAELVDSLSMARQCVRLCRQIGDRYELGAATRVLGETYSAQGNLKRAAACFRSAIRGLKNIHECYELMRALYAQGAFLGEHGRRDDAEIALLEARQLAKKLELEYYQAQIAIALVDTLSPQERFNEASTWLTEATTLRDNLEGMDRKRVDEAVKRAANDLQDEITRASIREAETLKTICRVYEDARFPIAEMKPDLAYQVAQSAGGDWLFVAARKGGGFTVPLTYNIAVNEAKEIVRRLDDGPKRPLLGVIDSPRIFSLPNDRTLVAVPCLVAPPSRNGKENPKETFVFCTCFAKAVTVTSRQLEILNASSEALARLIEDDDERHAPPTQEEIASTRHPRGSFKDVLTIDPGMIKLIKLAEKAGASVAPILLEGETGVGKELFARAIHDASRRKDGPFVAVNAGGMSLALLESELFGHVRGAFTDATSDRVGFIDTARGGTLFLDEIGETSEELQVKLLRLIENGEYRRLGESTMRKADVRFVSATNRDLSKEVERGRFRRDLYYRVAPLRLTIPPLRFRTSDIQLMIRHFLRECAQMNGIADRHIEIDVKAMEALELYDWPGNVRELFNEILRVVSLIGRGDLVRFNMLSENIQEYLKNKKRGTDGLLERSVEQYERRLILHALERNDWNHLRTAESIGVPRTTLLAKLKRLNIASKL